MRRYERNGVILGVIDGEGLGDGIPRGQLSLVDANYMPAKKRWFEFVLTDKVTHIKIGTIFEYFEERIS